MQSLDPRWLSIELEAIKVEDGEWTRVLGDSYEIAVQRVLEFQAKVSSDLNALELAA